MKKLIFILICLTSLNCRAGIIFPDAHYGVITRIQYVDTANEHALAESISNANSLDFAAFNGSGGSGAAAVIGFLGEVFIRQASAPKKIAIYLITVVQDDGKEMIGFENAENFNHAPVFKMGWKPLEVGARVQYFMFRYSPTMYRLNAYVSDKPLPKDASPKAIAALGKKAPIIGEPMKADGKPASEQKPAIDADKVSPERGEVAATSAQ